MMAKARFALQELLRPLGLQIAEVEREDLGPGAIYYGPNISGISTSVLSIRYEPQTGDYFSSKDLYSQSSIEVIEGEITWQLIFPYREDSIAKRSIARDGKRKESLIRFFDIIAASFYWLSDWQVLGQSARDIHGRLNYSLSIQKLLGSSCLPFVDYYREILVENLNSRGHTLSLAKWKGSKMAACITHDIDYLKKWRKGMIYRDVIQRRRAPYQILMELAPAKDPFKISFDWMIDMEEERGFISTWFLKTGGAGRNDVVYDHKSNWLSKRIERLQKRGDSFGLHGSYFTSDDPNRFEEEFLKMKSIVPQFDCTRQHYLRYIHDKSLEIYEEHGVSFDSSIAFPDHEGFRTATCHPHPIYNLETDRPSSVWEFPLSVMESTLFSYRSLSTEDAIEVTSKIIDLCNRFGGVVVLLWHNIIKDRDDFEGLDVHFTRSLDKLKEMDCLVTSIPDCFRSRGNDD